MNEPAASVAPPAGRYRYLVLFMLFVAFTLNFLDRQIVAVLGTMIQRDLHLTDTQLGLMGGLAFAILYCGLGIPVALLADRKSRVMIVTVALSAWSFFTALCGAATGFWSFFLCRVGVGVGESGGLTPSYSLIADYFPTHQRSRAMAAFYFGLPVGSALGLVLGGVVAHQLGWRATFALVGIAGIVFAPLLALTVREPVRGALDGHQATTPVSRPTLAGTLSVLRHKPGFWLASFAASIMAMAGYGLAFWLPSYFQRALGFSLVQTALAVGGLTLVSGCIAVPSGGILADWLGGRHKNAYGLLPAGDALIGLAALVGAMSVHQLWPQMLLFLVALGSSMFWPPAILSAVQHLLPWNMRATGSAIYSLIVNLIGLSGGLWLFGFISDRVAPRLGAGSLQFSILLGSSVMLPLAALLFWLAGRHFAGDWEGSAAPQAT